MRHIVIAIAIMMIPNLSFGQFNETIRSGRPGQSIGPYTVGKKVVQVQSGVNFNQIDNEMTETSSFSESTVLRIGVWERFELSGVVNWESNQIRTNGDEEYEKGISNTQIGGRINILEGKGAIPGIGLQGRALLKAQSQAFKRETTGSQFVLATGNQITDWLSLGTNWGVTWDGNNANPRSLYIVNLSFGLSEKFGGFAEVYGSINELTTNFDGGFSYLVNNDLQLDVSGGWQGSEGVSDWFVDLGVSWRYDWRD